MLKFDSTAGANSRTRKLSEDDVYAIRQLYDEGVGIDEIKEQLDLPVHRWTIADIGRRRKWRSLPERGDETE